MIGLVPVANKGQELIPHKDYEIKQDGDRFYLVKKKKEYPTTIEECCKILGLEFNPFYTGVKRQVNYKDGLLHNLKCLLIYRDAYWKLYGEEMGLEKPWEPDWTTDDIKYCLINIGNKMCQSYECKVKRTLAFPTEEMSVQYHVNFGPDIETCKELL